MSDATDMIGTGIGLGVGLAVTGSVLDRFGYLGRRPVRRRARRKKRR